MKSVQPRVTARMTVLKIPFDKPPAADELKRRDPGQLSSRRACGPVAARRETAGSRGLPIAAWTFGNDLAMVFLSNEVVVDYALRLEREFAAAQAPGSSSGLWINAYSNEVTHYIASNRLLKEGGYEVNNSLNALVSYGRPNRCSRPSKNRIVQCVRRLLPESFRAAK